MIWGGADVIIIDIKCTTNIMHLNHFKTTTSRSMEKLSSMKLVPGAKKVGTATLTCRKCSRTYICQWAYYSWFLSQCSVSCLFSDFGMWYMHPCSKGCRAWSFSLWSGLCLEGQRFDRRCLLSNFVIRFSNVILYFIYTGMSNFLVWLAKLESYTQP